MSGEGRGGGWGTPGQSRESLESGERRRLIGGALRLGAHAGPTSDTEDTAEAAERQCGRCHAVGRFERRGRQRFCAVCGAAAEDEEGPEEVNELFGGTQRSRRLRTDRATPSGRKRAKQDPAEARVEPWTKYLEGLQRVLKRQSAALVEGRLGCRPELDEVLWRLWAAGLRRSAALNGAVGAPEAERLIRVAEAVPVAATLGVAFLGCCLLREAVLPQDLRAEALAGRLPYLGAHGALPPDILAAVPASRPNGVPYLKPGHLPDPPEIVASARAWAREIGLEGAAGSGPERPCVLELNLPGAVARFAAAMSLPPYAPQLALRLFQAHAAWCRPLLRWRGPARSEAGASHGAVKLSARKDAACYAMALLVVALRFFHPLIGKPVTSRKKATVKKYVKRGTEWGQAAYLGGDGLAPDWYQWGREQLRVLRDPDLRPTFAAAVERRAPVPAGAEAEFVGYLGATVLQGFQPAADLREIAQALGKAALQAAEGAEGAQRDTDDEDAAEAEAAFQAAFCPNQHPYPAVRTGTRFFPVQGGEGKDWAVGTHQEYRIVVAAAAAHIWAAPGNLQAAIRDVEEQLRRAEGEGGGAPSLSRPAPAPAAARGPER